jgi:hypothetical protein
MKKKKLIFIIVSLVIGIFTIQACKTYYFRANYLDANKLLHETNNTGVKPFMKVHIKNGDVIILRDSWRLDTIKDLVSGEGIRYNFNRSIVHEGSISVPIDSVAIFETNDKLLNPESGRITALSILTGVDVLVGLICITNPKACFGSCPTFYMNETDNFHFADAEGFTNAISPSMEYSDIDALNNKQISGNNFSITMKNEALETHCVNDVKILAFPRKKDERIYQSPANDFYLCKNNYSVSKAKGSEGDITGLLKNDDRMERFSLSDETNLLSKEEIYLTFDDVKNNNELGLIINFRQTLMTTYLFYSAMGYMGDNVGDVFSKLETDNEMKGKFDATSKALGDIDVYNWNDQKNIWELIGGLSEAGPIAINRQIIPLKTITSGSSIKLKLVLNKGLWRIDYLALTNIKEKVTPIEISPVSILNKGKIDHYALSLINNPGKYLISMPGSEYKFNYILPEQNDDYELFLYSKGYYLEWMRVHWLKDKDLLKLKQMVINPKEYLKTQAAEYKHYETHMENEFWNSKIDTKIFSYYEN